MAHGGRGLKDLKDYVNAIEILYIIIIKYN